MEYGLCCKCLSLAEKGIRQKTVTFKSFSALPRDSAMLKLSEIWLNNAIAAMEAVSFCADKGIARYRLSSDIFPLATHPEARIITSELRDFPEIKKVLLEIGKLSKKYGVGLSFHPSQFVSICSPNIKTRLNSVNEINSASSILDLIGMPTDARAPINIHLNSNPEKNPDLKNYFDASLNLLSRNARNRLTLENEDRGYWNAERLIRFLSGYKIPVVLDIHHESLNPSPKCIQDIAKLAASTWPINCIPIFHISRGKKDAPRSHDDFCSVPPKNMPSKAVYMVEAKAKDFAVLNLIENSKKNNKKNDMGKR